MTDDQASRHALSSETLVAELAAAGERDAQKSYGQEGERSSPRHRSDLKVPDDLCLSRRARWGHQGEGDKNVGRLNGDPHVSDIRWYQHVDVKRVVTGGTGGWRDVHEKSPKLISTPPGPIRNPQSGPMRCMPPDKSRASGNPGASKPRP